MPYQFNPFTGTFDTVNDVSIFKETVAFGSGDANSNLTIGTKKDWHLIPFNYTITGVRGVLDTAPTGSALEFDLLKNGSTIFTTKPVINSTQTDTITSSIPSILSITSGSSGDIFRLSITQVGAVVTGRWLRVYLLLERS